MANTPAAEVEVSPALVRGLLEAQHPDLAASPLRLAAEGWDNVIFRLGDDLAVRLPRREAAAQLIRQEQLWLPGLLSGISTRTSVPVRTGAPSSSYPWHWSITQWVHGTVAAEAAVPERTPAAEGLADFVLAFGRTAPADAPHNSVRGGTLAGRDAAVQERLDTGRMRNAEQLRALWARLRSQPGWDGPALWLHGDLHAANLVLGTQKRLETVLDFGDLTAGDPATDLAAGWLVFDRHGRRAFQNRVNAVRPADDATWQRARGWALCIGAAMAAHSDDNEPFLTMGRRILDEVLHDDGRT